MMNDTGSTMNVSPVGTKKLELEMMAFSFSEYFDVDSTLLNLLFGLEADLHKILDGLLLLNGRQEHVNPQNVVVTQLVEELRIGIPDNLVVLLEVNCNHKTLSFLKLKILFGRGGSAVR